MNEELQKALAEMINKSVAAAVDALAFTQEQLPEVVQQLLAWKLAEALVYAGAAPIVVFICCYFLKKVAQAKPKELGRKHENWAWEAYETISPSLNALGVLGSIAAALCICASAIFWWAGVFTALQIWLAPKVYLIEYASKLVN